MHVRALTYTHLVPTPDSGCLVQRSEPGFLYPPRCRAFPPSVAIADYIVLILLERLVPRDSIDAVVDYPSTRSELQRELAEESTVAHEQISADSSSAALFADEKKTN